MRKIIVEAEVSVDGATRTMLEHGLVDEFRILVFPFAFGAGPRLFEQTNVKSMKLLDTKTFSSGVVALRYQL